MRKLLLSFLFCLTLVACEQGKDSTPTESAGALGGNEQITEKSESEKLNQWFEEKYEEELMMSPIGLTFLGRKERYGEIDDMSEAAEDKQVAWKKQTVEEMKSTFDYNALSDDAKLSYDLWAYQYEEMAADIEFRGNAYVFNQMQGVHSFFATLMVSFHKVESHSDMQAYNSRLSQIGRGMHQLLERAQSYAEAGVRPPRFAYEIVTKEATAIIAGAPFDDSDTDSSIWADAQLKVADLVAKQGITEDQADALLAQAKTALVNDLEPAYQALVDFMQSDIENTSETAQGVHALPNGAAYYEHQLKWTTTTSMTADQVHQLGLDEVKRIRAEMEAIKEKTGYQGTLQEFFTYIRDS
jgi:uncharacterized protein (DUF885 family)